MIDVLYDLIGGKETVWAATESFYPCSPSARAGAGLNDGHFDRFRHFREALTEVGVEAYKVAKVIKILKGKRSAVLNP